MKTMFTSDYTKKELLQLIVGVIIVAVWCVTFM